MDQSGIFECCICFHEYDYGHMKDKDICAFCFEKLPSGSLHPVKQTPIEKCVCGKKLESNVCNSISFAVVHFVSKAFGSISNTKKKETLY
jgi:hypothetical protein